MSYCAVTRTKYHHVSTARRDIKNKKKSQSHPLGQQTKRKASKEASSKKTPIHPCGSIHQQATTTATRIDQRRRHPLKDAFTSSSTVAFAASKEPLIGTFHERVLEKKHADVARR